MTAIFSVRLPGQESVERLFETCPPSFKQRQSPWRQVVKEMRLAHGAKIDGWKFKVSGDQREVLMGWLMWLTIESADSPDLTDPIAAWILAELLPDPPAFVHPRTPDGPSRFAP